MFKKLLQSLSKSQTKPIPAATPPVTSQPPVEVPKATPSVLAPPASKKLQAALQPAVAKRPPEQLCGITAQMTPEQILAQLKLLYRRYNRSASSLDSKLRNEAEEMLNAIVEVREKHFGQI